MILFILSLSYFLHLTATVMWIGGMAMVLLVILPAAKMTLGSASIVGQLMKAIAKRFASMANVSIFLLIVTGIVIAHYEGKRTGFLDFGDPSSFIMILKHVLVALMILIHYYRIMILNPKAEKISSKTHESHADPILSSKATRLRKLSLDLVKVNLILGTTVLLLTALSVPILALDQISN